MNPSSPLGQDAYPTPSLDSGLMFASLPAAQFNQYSFTSLPYPEHQDYQPTEIGETIYEPAPLVNESEHEDDELTHQTRAVLDENGFVPGQSVTGGRAAAAKKITADLDLTDQIISRMKAEGYRDAHIRDHLVRLGLESYNEKTISTRNIRIRRVLLAKETASLDEEDNDWAQQDDEHLIAAVESLSEIHKSELKALQTKHWVEIAQKKKQLDNDARHSSNGCRRRYDALLDGTARIPYDIDPDQESRMTEIKIKVASVKADRKARASAIRQTNEEASRLAQEKADRDREIEGRKQQRKAEQERSRMDRAIAQANRKHEEQAKQLEQTRREAEKQERNRSRMADAERRRRDAEEDKAKRLQLREEQKKQRLEQRMEAEIAQKEKNLRAQQKKLEDVRDKHISARIVAKFGKKLVSKMNEQSDAAKQHADQARAAANAALHTAHADTIAQDPRASMRLQELRELCRKRTLARAGTTVDLVTRLRQYDDGRKVSELQADLAARGAHKTGSKAQLLHRLASIDAGLYVHPAPRNAVTAKRKRGMGAEVVDQEDDSGSKSTSKRSKSGRLTKGKAKATAEV